MRVARNYTIEIADGISMIRFTSMPEKDDFLSAMNEVAGNHFSVLRLWDLSCGVDLSSAEVRQVAEHGKSTFTTPSRVAIVAPTDLAFGLARMEDVYREDSIVEQQVFRSLQEARAWLKS